jgi:hypothetical protein
MYLKTLVEWSSLQNLDSTNIDESKKRRSKLIVLRCNLPKLRFICVVSQNIAVPAFLPCSLANKTGGFPVTRKYFLSFCALFTIYTKFEELLILLINPCPYSKR